MKQQKTELFSALPLAQLRSRKSLMSQGFSSHTLDNHLKSGALRKIVKGIYIRQESKLSWQGVVSSLPNMMSSPVTVGGLTALELQGFAQYLSFGTQRIVHLYSPAPCPAWLKNVFRQIPDTQFYWHRTALLWMNGWPEKAVTNEHKWLEESSPMLLSAPEQAILETFMSVPDEISFEHAEQLMQGLTQLSPRKLQALLQSCKNVKVKRLFFWFVDRFTYAWCGRLDVNDYDLGSGKRVVAENGRLDKRYNITVPKEFYQGSING